jgi:hypothetical protein
MGFKYVILDLSFALRYYGTPVMSRECGDTLSKDPSIKSSCPFKINHSPSDVAFEYMILSLDDPSV